MSTWSRFRVPALTRVLVVGLGLLLYSHAASQAQPASAPALCPEVQKEPNNLDPSVGYITSGKDNWLFLKGDLRAVEDANFVFWWTTGYVERLSNALKSRGITLVVAPIPMRSAVYPEFLDRSKPVQAAFDQEKVQTAYLASVKDLRGRGVVVADLLSTYLAAKTQGPVFFKTDHHWTAFGAQAAAQTIAGEIKSQSSPYSQLPKSTFNTEAFFVTREYLGGVGKIVEATCKIKWPTEVKTNVRQVVGEAHSDDLLGETHIPVVVAGTSNSTVDSFGFTSYLNQYLGLSTLNAAISGGGPFTPLQAYLLGDDYASDKPNYIVWEMMVSDPPRNTPFFRQLVPSVYGACDAKSTVSDARITVKPADTRVTLFSLTEKQDVSGTKNYLYLEAADTALMGYQVVISYADGKKDTVVLTRSPRWKNNGKWFLEFSNDFKSTVTSVDLILKGASGPISARICNAT